MAHSEEGAEEEGDALDRLIRRRVFEPVDPDAERDDPPSAPDPVDPEGYGAPDRAEEIRSVDRPGYASQPTLDPRTGHVRRARTVATNPSGDLVEGWEQLRQSVYYRGFIVAAVVVAAFLVWRIAAGLLAGDGGSIVDRLLSLEDPFSPVVSPDDPVVLASIDLRAALRVAAPLVLAVFWLAGGYQIDRAARRVFGATGTPGSRLPKGYVVSAIGCVFPLIVFGMIGVAWGGINLGLWAIENKAWGPTGVLLALLLAFVVVIRVLVGWQDRQERVEFPGDR